MRKYLCAEGNLIFDGRILDVNEFVANGLVGNSEYTATGLLKQNTLGPVCSK